MTSDTATLDWAAGMLDLTLRRATTLARFIDNLINTQKKAPLLDLLPELYSVKRVLLHLQESVQSEAPVDQWATILTTLCGPSGALQQCLLMLEDLISTFSPIGGPRERTFGRAANSTHVMSMKRRCEKQKILLLSTLQNDPQYVRTQDSTQSLMICRVLSQVMEDISIPRLDEQGGEVGSWQPVEVDPRDRVIQWLLGYRVPLDDLETVTLPVPGTGQWLLESKEFAAWKTNPQSVLWLYGIRSGKTTLCASVIEHMRSNNTPSDALAYFFFGSNQGVAGNCIRCIRSLVAQLYNASRRLPIVVQTLSSRSHAHDQSILLKDLQLLILSQRRTFIILDGIDEAQDKGKVMEMLSILANKQLKNLRLLISSRPETKNIKTLNPMMITTLGIEGGTLNKDISIYIEHYFHISATTKMWDESVKREIRDWLVSKADGSFLWITFCLVFLERCPELKTDIQSLPKTMPGVFDRLLSNIPEEKEKEAHQALQWLAFAERPLYLEELAEAAIMSSKADGSPYTHLPTSYAINDICSGLITLIPTIEDGTYREKVVFAHHSLRDYLMSGGIESSRAAIFAIKAIDAQLMISHASLNYYLSSMLHAPLSMEQLNGLPLLGYVADYWYRHVEAVTADIPMPEDLANLAIKLLDERYKWGTWIDRGTAFIFWPGKQEMTRLLFGLEGQDLTRRWFRSGVQEWTCLLIGPEGKQNMNLKDIRFPPPLYYASCFGWIEVVQMLISRGDLGQEDTEWCSRFLGTALQAASYHGHYHVSGKLLKSGANANPASGYYGNPVQAAACGGHAELIDLLIRFRADIDAKGGVYGNALVAAAKWGHEAAVIKLTENGAKLNAEGSKDYPTALYAASLHGHREVVARLLHWGADPNREYGDGKFALLAAVQEGHEDVVALLIKYGAFLDQKCQGGLNIGELTLHMAAEGGHTDLVRLLLTWPCIDADSPNEKGLNPLLIAVSHGHNAVVQLLLNKGVDSRSTDGSGSTALMIAVRHGYLDVVRLLLKHNEDAGDTNIDGQIWTSLMMAVSGGNQGLVLLLLEFGAAQGLSNGHDQTPLMTAIQMGHEAITFLLLQDGVEIDTTDGSENRPIDVAVSKGYRTIEKLLKFGEGKKAIADRDRWWKSNSRVRDDWDEIK